MPRRILLDECVPARVRRAFPGHVVRTVPEAGWHSTKDGTLLSLAEANYDVFVTVDRKLERGFDQHRIGLVVVINIGGNRLDFFLPLFGELLHAVETVTPGEVIHVSGSANRRN